MPLGNNWGPDINTWRLCAKPDVTTRPAGAAAFNGLSGHFICPLKPSHYPIPSVTYYISSITFLHPNNDTKRKCEIYSRKVVCSSFNSLFIFTNSNGFLQGFSVLSLVLFFPPPDFIIIPPEIAMVYKQNNFFFFVIIMFTELPISSIQFLLPPSDFHANDRHKLLIV